MQRMRAECFADRDAPAFALLQIVTALRSANSVWATFRYARFSASTVRVELKRFRQRRYIVYVGIHVGCGGSIRYITDLQD